MPTKVLDALRAAGAWYGSRSTTTQAFTAVGMGIGVAFLLTLTGVVR